MSSATQPSSILSSTSNTHLTTTVTSPVSTVTTIATTTVTPTAYMGPLSGIGNGFGNHTNNTNNTTQQNSAIPTQTVFYFIAVFAFIVAISYAIHLVRRDRIKRRVGDALEDDEDGHRSRGRGHTSTYRPETDEVCPPQYRAYDPEMTIVFPDRALHSIYSIDSNDTASERPLLATSTTTTTIILRGAPLPNSSETTEAEAGPVIATPSPVLSLANHRQPHVVRSPSNSEAPSTPNTTSVSRASSSLSSSSSSSVPSPSSPSVEVVSQLDRFRNSIPTLNRLRSEGPPPYIPPAPEQSLPQLPPDYHVSVSS
ncbi:hypothetical protein BGZ52_008674 [Haplosporangium bisporale]|nr:hypothetical protein BGZ52_008674 [Haplosporangium bisporale]